MTKLKEHEVRAIYMKEMKKLVADGKEEDARLRRDEENAETTILAEQKEEYDMTQHELRELIADKDNEIELRDQAIAELKRQREEAHRLMIRLLLCAIFLALALSIADSFNSLEIDQPESHCWYHCCQTYGHCSTETCAKHQNEANETSSTDGVCDTALLYTRFRDDATWVLLFVFTRSFVDRLPVSSRRTFNWTILS